MKEADFRRIALSFEGAEEGSHTGASDFRVGGRIFAPLTSQDQGYGNLVLTPELQAEFVRDLPGVFLPIAGGWGRMGMTHIGAGERGRAGRGATNGMEALESKRMPARRKRRNVPRAAPKFDDKSGFHQPRSIGEFADIS